MLFTKKEDKQIKSFFILDRHIKDSQTDSCLKLSMSSYFKMRKYLILLTGSLLSIGLQGCGNNSEPSLDEIKKKIVKVETPKGKYTTVNKSSGAYGKYQIMPKTAKYYTKKLKIHRSEWKKPKNQDKIFTALLEDNIKNLKKYEFKVDAFTVYGCHQQGAYGFICIMKNQNLSSKSYMRLRRNLPSQYRNIGKNELRETWIDYWKNKMIET